MKTLIPKISLTHCTKYSQITEIENASHADWEGDEVSGSTAGRVDWDRWHELRDIMDKRVLTSSELAEYQRFARIVTRLDIEAARVSDAAMERLVEGHQRVIASIRRATRDLR